MTQQPPQAPVEEQETLTPTVADTVGGALRRVFSGLTLVGAALLGVGLLGTIAGGIVALLFKDISTFGVTLMFIGLAVALVGLVLTFQALSKGVGGRRGRYGLNTFLMVVALGGVLVLINFLAIRNSARIDLTATRQFSLSPASLAILKDLPQPVQATGFFRTNDPSEQIIQGRVDDLLNEFKRRSGSKFDYRFVDPELEPQVATKYGVTLNGTVVVEAMDSGLRQPVQPGAIQEQDFLTAILIATGKQQKKVYFLVGHGGRDPGDSAQGTAGFGLAVEALRDALYLSQPLNLTQTGEVTEDAAMVIVAGPTLDLQEGDQQRLDAYLKAGGRLMVLLEPNTPKSWQDFISRWGVKQEPGQVVDPRSSVSGDPRTPLIPPVLYAEHQITAPLDTTMFPGLSGLTSSVERLPATIEVQGLAITTPDSFITTDAERNEFRTGDKRGSTTVAAVVRALAPIGEEPLPSDNPPQAQIIIFGDSDFATNKYLYAFSNNDLFLNATNWLTGDYSLISVRPKRDVFRQFTPTQSQFDFIRYSSYLLLPTLMAVGAVFVWWRRR